MKGKSVYKIAKETGLNRSLLSKFRTGNTGLSLEKAAIVAQYLGLALIEVDRTTLTTPTLLESELENIINNARERLAVLADRTYPSSCLRVIEKALENRGLRYELLLFGDCRDLYAHVDRLSGLSRVVIRQAPQANYASITLADNSCIIGIPSPAGDLSQGTKFSGHNACLPFTDYFSDAFRALSDEKFQVRRTSDLRSSSER